MTDVYDTPLSPEEESLYSKMYSEDDSRDYDMKGYFKDILLDNPDKGANAPGEHYPDTYKKPWHPTFSDESMYHGVAGNEGGNWGRNDKGQDTFTPGPTNVKLHGLLGLIDYFDKHEPDNELLMPRK